MTSWINNDGYTITMDKRKIDLSALHKYLSEDSYWSRGIPFDIVSKAVENSICFSILSPTEEFAGFARMITDRATFGYLADVFVLDKYKGNGLGKWLIEVIMSYPEFKTMRNWFLYTKDAHSLYEKFGWQRIKQLDLLDKAMIVNNPAQDVYNL
ncbi:MAG: GNAT family N-acetyltransferase [Candidatus Heimdallarchaeota archaeon]|nr:GNAT family N-acetyltransferase [Candidatus Heimdallarchaeota archaeon]